MEQVALVKKVEAEVKKVEAVMSQNLHIPEYQRPYRWENKQVIELLEDIYSSWKQVKSAYRIGSVILHNHKNKLDIVDGQQRISTLILIILQLSNKNDSCKHLANTLQYKHTDSKNTIIQNSEHIKVWINQNIASEKNEFLHYILKYCEFVEVKVTDHSEAFQMFDSQNSKGKSLEAYNLLKAYHIRAMEEDAQNVKIACDVQWENATRHTIKENQIKDILKQLFNEQLYRPRLWSRKEDAHKFSKKDLDEFKGKTILKNQLQSFPFQNKDILQAYLLNYLETNCIELKGIKERFETQKLSNVNPFVSINQSIINGKAFFDYIETYTEIYKQLFIVNQANTLVAFKAFYKQNVNYPNNRVGDYYLKELYKSLILFVFDKYGEDGVNKYYKTLFAIVYRLRLEKQQVKYDAVMNYANSTKLFAIIDKSKSYSDLKRLNSLMMQSVDCRKEVPVIIEALLKLDIKINTTDIDLSKYSKK